MYEIQERLREFLSRGERVALATIISRKGATPRDVGAQMIIHPLGRHVGTVGGGCGEAEVIRTGLDVIQTGEPAVVEVDLTEPISLESTAVCGGKFRVYVEPWGPTPDDLALLEAWLNALRERKPVVRLVIVQARGKFAGLRGARLLLVNGEIVGSVDPKTIPEQVIHDAQQVRARSVPGLSTHRFSSNDVIEVFHEAHEPAPRIIIVGAGHIGAALARLAKVNEFYVTVLDDRPMYANRERFPDADEIIVAPMAQALREMAMDEYTYVVLVTRGHQLDFECLQAVLDKPVPYIGMIGSRRRVRAVFQLLEEEKGILQDLLVHIRAPIGLDIGAQTPSEIATAIMAEIIMARRGGTGRPLSEIVRNVAETPIRSV